jgi:RimJ/RimL family protein N-acetyltransferase
MKEINALSVREMVEDDIEHFVRYWEEASPAHLEGMGVDLSKRPTRELFEKLVTSQLGQPMEERKAYFLTWVKDGHPVGSLHVNQIVFGKQAYMHLHLWDSENRQKGMGQKLVKKSLPFFFENLNLQQLFCEPYALNPAPNKTVEKLGFTFVIQHTTIPGASNFEQLVNLWKLTREQHHAITAQQHL